MMPLHKINKWLGVRGERSSGSPLSFVRGLQFIIDSTSQNSVSGISSVKRTVLGRMAAMIRRIIPIILSQAPPMWEAVGGLKFHAIPLLTA